MQRHPAPPSPVAGEKIILPYPYVSKAKGDVNNASPSLSFYFKQARIKERRVFIQTFRHETGRPDYGSGLKKACGM